MGQDGTMVGQDVAKVARSQKGAKLSQILKLNPGGARLSPRGNVASCWTATSLWECRPKRLSYKLATEGMEAKKLKGKRLRVQDDDEDDDDDDCDDDYDFFVTN